MLAFIFLWVVGSCVATPLIGGMLFRTLDSRSEYRSSNRFVESKRGPNKDRIVGRVPSAVSPICRVYRRRPAASVLTQRVSGRLQR